MAKLAVFLAILGLAYWYWSGPYQESTRTAERLQENAEIMKRCIDVEQRMWTAGASSENDFERSCAEKNNLYRRDGKWHNKQDH